MGSLCVAILMGVLACQSSSDETAEPPPPPPDVCPDVVVTAATLEFQVTLPADTDPALDGLGQISIAPAGTPANKLFVFLGGLGSIPADYIEIVRVAAAAGYHAIGLGYSNTTGLAAQCGTDTEACPCAMRREMITGEDASPQVVVDTTHSIDNRLVKMLEHLGWSQYLNGGVPDWPNITIAGHSLGGGNAMMIAQLRRVHRALAIAQPWPEVAGWLGEPFQTPDERLWGFVHGAEADAAEVMTAWESIGIPGAPTDVDALHPPYEGSHQLFTMLPMSDTHSGVAADGSTPRDPQGTPELARRWCFLVGP